VNTSERPARHSADRGAPRGRWGGYARVAAVAAASFALVAVCSALGWLLPGDELLLRALVIHRSCTAVALSSLASFVAAIDSAIVLTVLLVAALAVAGPGWRALWLAAWALGLPLELAFKLLLRHPLPASVVPPGPLLCEGSSPLSNPYLSPLTSPTTSPLLNPEGQVIQPLLGAAVGHTFPSGYAVRLTFFTVLACMWLWGRLPAARRGWVVGSLAALAVALAATRLLLVWHWPSDLLGGMALGIALACVARIGWELTPTVWRPTRAVANSQTR
jgi:membrane-associated phospholipid phosphatase